MSATLQTEDVELLIVFASGVVDVEIRDSKVPNKPGGLCLDAAARLCLRDNARRLAFIGPDSLVYRDRLQTYHSPQPNRLVLTLPNVNGRFETDSICYHLDCYFRGVYPNLNLEEMRRQARLGIVSDAQAGKQFARALLAYGYRRRNIVVYESHIPAFSGRRFLRSFFDSCQTFCDYLSGRKIRVCQMP